MSYLFVGNASLVVSRGNDADQTPVSRRQQRWSRLLLLLLSKTTRFWKGRNSCRPHRRRNLRTPKVDETNGKTTQRETETSGGSTQGGEERGREVTTSAETQSTRRDEQFWW